MTTPKPAQTPEEVARCTECGMWCEPGEYHPFAACLMFRACSDRRTVRANLRIAHPDLLRAAAQAERERIAQWARNAERRMAIMRSTKATYGAEALRAFADNLESEPRLSPAPEGGES